MTGRARPVPGAPREYHFPPFTRRTLENGVRLVLAPVPKLPLASIVVLVNSGAVGDPAGREGVAQLTAGLLLEGTDRLDGAELTERFERLGASVDAYADWDAAVVRMTVLTEYLRPALALLAEVLRQPAFPDREVERLRAERLAELLQLRAEPRGLADAVFSKFLYEPRSRYATLDGGNEASVMAVTRADVAAFYRARYQPEGVTVIVAGDVSAGAAEGMLRDTLGEWTATAPAPTPVGTSDAPAHGGRAVHLVAKTDAAQTELRMGHVGLPRNHPDYFQFAVMNALLGGLFTSRINLNLREEHGYTYGAFSGVDWRRQAGPFVVSTAVQSDVTAEAAREVLREIERMRSDIVSEDELSLATSYLSGVFPIRYETTAAIASALANLVVYEFPEDFYDTYRDRVRAVTAEQVLEAARRYLHPESLQMVAVGDPAAVREPLAALDIAPVIVHDAANVAL